MEHSYSIKTDSVSLFPLKREDIQIVRNWRNSDNIRFCFVNSGIISAEQQEQWYVSYLNKAKDFTFSIFDNQLNKIIGMCALYNFSDDNLTAEFGRFMIGDPDARGKGIGVEALNAALKISFDILKLEKVVLEVYSDNLPALKTYLKCGFRIVETYMSERAELTRMIISKEEFVYNDK